jgi:hypothetical protein
MQNENASRCFLLLSLKINEMRFAASIACCLLLTMQSCTQTGSGTRVGNKTSGVKKRSPDRFNGRLHQPGAGGNFPGDE